MSLMTAQKTAPGPQVESDGRTEVSQKAIQISSAEWCYSVKYKRHIGDTPNSDMAENIRLCERNDVLKAK